MNTDTRRNIFCILMTAEDYLDAFEKLHRLGLKDRQEEEIIHVLLHCCLQENKFNLYYAVLAEKLCEYNRKYQVRRSASYVIRSLVYTYVRTYVRTRALRHKLFPIFQLTIQYNLWDKLKTLESLKTKQLSNLARFFTHLFVQKCLAFSILKVSIISFIDIVQYATNSLSYTFITGYSIHRTGQVYREIAQTNPVRNFIT